MIACLHPSTTWSRTTTATRSPTTATRCCTLHRRRATGRICRSWITSRTSGLTPPPLPQHTHTYTYTYNPHHDLLPASSAQCTGYLGFVGSILQDRPQFILVGIGLAVSSIFQHPTTTQCFQQYLPGQHAASCSTEATDMPAYYRIASFLPHSCTSSNWVVVVDVVVVLCRCAIVAPKLYERTSCLCFCRPGVH